MISQLNQTTLNKFKHVFLNKKNILILYIALAIIATTKQYLHHSYNNYLIFKGVFWHTVQFKNLYLQYPLEYLDSNHYGPFFALIIAPFALLPNGLALYLWNIANVLILFLGIYSLPLSDKKRALIALICSHEMLTALFSFQFNIALTGLIILSFSYLIKNKTIQSTFFITVGTLVKLYGIVGLAFFFFTKNKISLIISGIYKRQNQIANFSKPNFQKKYTNTQTF